MSRFSGAKPSIKNKIANVDSDSEPQKIWSRFIFPALKELISMTDFALEMRHRCRNRKCGVKLARPIELAQRAFCCRGCHGQFYRRRCVVCECELLPGPTNRKLCRKAKCRADYRKFPDLYKWPESMRTANHSQNGERPSKSADSIGIEIGHADDRLRLIRNAQQVEFYGGGQWHEVISPDGVRCFVTRLWGNELVAA